MHIGHFIKKKCFRNIFRCNIQVYPLCRSKTCPKQVSKGLKYINWITHWAQEWFDLDLWTGYLKIFRDHLLIESNPCTKFGIDQVKWSKDIEWTTQWAEKSSLTLTFEYVTWKSIGIIYSLRAVSYTHLRAHETSLHLVCRLLLEKRLSPHPYPAK